MVLLLHWSMLNYAAVVKILKKHGAAASALSCCKASACCLLAPHRETCPASSAYSRAAAMQISARAFCCARRSWQTCSSRCDQWRGGQMCVWETHLSAARRSAAADSQVFLALQPLRRGALTWSAAAQPFYSTEHITELVRDAEQRIEALRQGDAGVTTLGSAATAAKVERLRETEALLFRRARAGLRRLARAAGLIRAGRSVRSRWSVVQTVHHVSGFDIGSACVLTRSALRTCWAAERAWAGRCF